MRQRDSIQFGAAGWRGNAARSAAALLFVVLPFVHVAAHQSHNPASRGGPLPALAAHIDEAHADEQDCPICQLSAEDALEQAAVELPTPPTTRRANDIPPDDAVSGVDQDAPAAARAPPAGL